MPEKNSPNKTLTELATEYMQEYYCTLTHLGEADPKTKINFACWQVLKDVATDIRHIKDTEKPQEVKPPLLSTWVSRVQSFFKKFRFK